MTELFDIIVLGAQTFLGLQEFIALVIGLAMGIIIGVLPGLGPLMGVVLAIPFTFYMTPVAGMALLLGIYQGGSYGGAISATVLGIPGTPMAASTLLDAHPMARKGFASEAVSLSTVASSFGGVIGGLILLVAAPPLAAIAMRFGPAETFAMAFLGLTSISSLTEGSVTKGLIAGILGLVVATVGNDPITGFPRFTFGTPFLEGGVNLVSLLVGVFAISEVLMQIEQPLRALNLGDKVGAVYGTVKTIISHPIVYLRASTIGTFIGAVPGVGGVTASFLAYNVAKNSDPDTEEYGQGKPEGIMTTEASNSAVCGGAMIPMLSLGIPGDPIVAALMGGLLIQGLTPGPPLFLFNPEIVYGIFVAFVVGAFLLLPIGFLGIPIFVRVLRVPHAYLVSGVLLLSIAGTFALQSQIVDLWLMWLFGVVGYLMRKGGYPLAPLVIGMVLGPIVESNFRRTLYLVDESFWTFLLSRPIALGILVAAVLFFAWPFVAKELRRRKLAA